MFTTVRKAAISFGMLALIPETDGIRMQTLFTGTTSSAYPRSSDMVQFQRWRYRWTVCWYIRGLAQRAKAKRHPPLCISEARRSRSAQQAEPAAAPRLPGSCGVVSICLGNLRFGRRTHYRRCGWQAGFRGIAGAQHDVRPFSYLP